jgi:hypothetical protein
MLPPTTIPLTPSRGPRIVGDKTGGNGMAKKKKEESIEDILDRMEEDIQKIRDKTDEDVFDDEDEEEDEE